MSTPGNKNDFNHRDKREENLKSTERLIISETPVISFQLYLLLQETQDFEFQSAILCSSGSSCPN